MAFRCHTCGQEHDTLPDLGADKPDPWFGIPAADRARRVKLTSDTCVIDGLDHFVRGVALLPLTDADVPGDAFGIGGWVSLSPKNFRTYIKHFDSADTGPFVGRFSTAVRTYAPPTSTLKARVHFRAGNQRPLFDWNRPTTRSPSPSTRASPSPAPGTSATPTWADAHRRRGPSPLRQRSAFPSVRINGGHRVAFSGLVAPRPTYRRNP